MVNFSIFIVCLYASVGFMLWVKVAGAIFCIMSGGGWSKAAKKVPKSVRDEFSDGMVDFGDALQEIDDEIGGTGFAQAAGVTLLSVVVIASLALNLVKCLICWPIVFRKAIRKRINSMMR